MAHPQPGLEAYLLAKCDLTARLLKTARGVCPPALVHCVPPNIEDNELLLLVIHKYGGMTVVVPRVRVHGSSGA